MASRSAQRSEIAVSSHSNGLIGVTDSGLQFGPIVTTRDKAEIS
ncbi:hypothetical protein EV188_103317 [Actinomycetospora succinea]|uniref:Uncharacterized protein n=1 Tax=Actinomycetospora succinea TaxID=663603 RepID=A0A4R6VN70_9PSEU|nr:hypothetical protein EV188_103317 [Actinomycetospora succinea]